MAWLKEQNVKCDPFSPRIWTGGLSVLMDSFHFLLFLILTAKCSSYHCGQCGPPCISDSGSINTLPTTLDLLLWYLVSIALKSFLWRLFFFLSSHSMPSLSCPNQCEHHLDRTFISRECLGHLSPNKHAQLRGHQLSKPCLPIGRSCDAGSRCLQGQE